MAHGLGARDLGGLNMTIAKWAKWAPGLRWRSSPWHGFKLYGVFVNTVVRFQAGTVLHNPSPNTGPVIIDGGQLAHHAQLMSKARPRTPGFEHQRARGMGDKLSLFESSSAEMERLVRARKGYAGALTSGLVEHLPPHPKFQPPADNSPPVRILSQRCCCRIEHAFTLSYRGPACPIPWLDLPHEEQLESSSRCVPALFDLLRSPAFTPYWCTLVNGDG
ncbi:hypothetical protein FA13DRAFT_1712899 [Coprinellus micaceus]|uniref:Uncharacterized protein n=1 Tax=Coprinellus micaceus TaxID=71717 RepID=A0A4Y7SYI7_COPMI|nr:hypothetical protein FA13DRAFT_1712899 [Coprinellus micaceus]